MDEQGSSSPPHYLEPPPPVSSNLGHQSQTEQGRSQGRSSDLGFYRCVPMDSREPTQDPTLSSPSHPPSSPQAPQDSELEVSPNTMQQRTSHVLQADPAVFANRHLPAPLPTPQRSSPAGPSADPKLGSPFGSPAAIQASRSLAPRVSPQPSAPHTPFTLPGVQANLPASQNVPQSGSPLCPTPTPSNQLGGFSQDAGSLNQTERPLTPMTAGETSKDGALKRPSLPVSKRPTKRLRLNTLSSRLPSTSKEREGTGEAMEGTKGRTAAAKPLIIPVLFNDVVAHTAKCDQCNKRNKHGMFRCAECGWQVCNSCNCERGGDRSHPNVRGLHVPREEVSNLTSTQGQSSSQATSSSPHIGTDRQSAVAGPSQVPPVGTFNVATARFVASNRAQHNDPTLHGTQWTSIQQNAPNVNTEEALMSPGTVSNTSAGTQTDITHNYQPRVHDGWTIYGPIEVARHASTSDLSDLASNESDLITAPLTSEEEAAQALIGLSSQPSSDEIIQDSEIMGEEFRNPRRNPSRKARPIDLKD